MRIELIAVLESDDGDSVGSLDGTGIALAAGDDLGSHDIDDGIKQALVDNPAREFQTGWRALAHCLQIAKGDALAIGSIVVEDIPTSTDHGRRAIAPTQAPLPEQGIVNALGLAQQRLGLHSVEAQEHGDDIARVAGVDVANQGYAE